ncbi:ABC transporter substrate-binding protein [Isobaculum melis]|uniref:Amino acid/amide ABC transporter substrate-binding protein, HAAT family n=1 Tax=Isobaculum melis TaxID=142588 RepID=A0A1H9PVK3_9LACT|nr:ABC transporter substrate-binding protein [Isobaculum melis]SER52160.1 amino acid/amide ABC transporter substrate-binding protein, HAAT family [Isobaculum melis]
MKKLVVTMMAATLLLAGCSGGKSKDSAETIKIGVNLEQSGPVSSYGNAELEGVQLAVEEINEKGGVLGKKLELVELDNKSDTTEVASVATKLASKEKVSAIIGPATSGNVKAAIPATNQAKVPLIAPSGTDDSVTMDNNDKVQPYVFRVCFQDSFQGEIMAAYAENDLGAKKAAILSDSSSDYAKGLTAAFKDSFTGDIVSEENYQSKDTDFSAVLTKMKSKGMDVLFIPGYYEEAGLIVKQAREAGIEVPILGADGFDSPELVKLAGKSALNKVYFPAHFSSLSEEKQVQDFLTNYKKKFDKEPNAFSALAYDSVYLLVDAIERADSADSEKITEALEATEDYQGLTGKMTIDKDHNAVKTATIVELKEGEQTVVAE